MAEGLDKSVKAQRKRNYPIFSTLIWYSIAFSITVTEFAL